MDARILSLNGAWDLGLDRQYDRTVAVPGLATDPAQVTPGMLWYRRQVALPEGDWSHATLTLNGARFCPAVFVDGVQVSAAEGGMTRTQHLLASPAVRPGATVTLEIALTSLDEMPAADASRIPSADRWRSNISSCLWDDVTLRVHGASRLTRVAPYYDPEASTVNMHYVVDGPASVCGTGRIRLECLRPTGEVIWMEEDPALDWGQTSALLLPEAEVRPWSPDEPNLYRLRTTLLDEDRVDDIVEFTWAPHDFRHMDTAFGTTADGIHYAPHNYKPGEKRFHSYGHPVTFRAGTVVWHRWVRDAEGRELAWDYAWFEEHIVKRLKAHGANGLRFHLGMPPEAILDLCDRHGLLVQVEWSFFHGMEASGESLRRQWREWFDLLMHHPCVAIIHPWNETEGDQLAAAFEAIEEVTAGSYAVVSHRDVLHVHKYWWSMFENVGLYYDSAEQFPMPVVADEFGGNYLDGEGNPGGYPSLKESFLRFLGRGHTARLRLQLQEESNARVAEYWRRIGVAGFSPFCLLGSWEDGNHHFLGPLREGRPKPVWDALTAAYSPVSVSLDVWDRNFAPGQTATLPLHLFNETAEARTLDVALRVLSADGRALREERLSRDVPAFGHTVEDVTFVLPDGIGEYRLAAELVGARASSRAHETGDAPGARASSRAHDPCDDARGNARAPIVSSWRVRTLVPRVPDALLDAIIGVPDDEAELRAMLGAVGLPTCAPDDPRARVLLAGRATWERGDWSPVEAALARGAGVVLLDIGPRELGQGYLEGGDLGPLQGAMWIPEPGTVETPLFWGLSAHFREMPEPESCLHPAESDGSLWAGLGQQATWLWNGYRGGLIVPARDLALVGLSPDAFLTLWAGRGADARAIEAGGHMAYELAGYYAFSDGSSDEVQRELRRRVRFLVDDAPALAVAINPNAPIIARDLSAEYRRSAGRATALVPLANAGKNLSRTPVVAVRFAPAEGTLILSQLLTQGRMAAGRGTPGPYGIGHDPAAVQVVLNMLARTV